jgi:hypothetical protein
VSGCLGEAAASGCHGEAAWRHGAAVARLHGGGGATWYCRGGGNGAQLGFPAVQRLLYPLISGLRVENGKG